MKKTVFLTVVFCFLLSGPGTLFSQSLADSLFKVLKNAKEDTSNVRNLNSLAWELKYYNTDTAITLSKQALDISEKINWDKGRAHSFHNIGLFNYLKGDYKTALVFYNKALYVCEKLEKRRNDEEILTLKAKTMGYMGLVFSNQGNLLKALDFYLDALKIDEKLKNNSGIARHLGNIGIVYYELKKFDRSLEYYFRALKLAEQTGYVQLQANTYGNIGLIYSEKKDNANALDYYDKALELADKNGFKELQANTLENIGNIYAGSKDYEKALERFEIALKIKEEGGSKRDIAISLNFIAGVHAELKNFREAEKYYLRSKVLVDSAGTVSLKKETYKGLARIYYIKKDWKKAYEYYNDFVSYNDTLLAQQNQRDLSRKEIEFEYAKKVAQDSIKNAEERKTNAAKVLARDEQLKRAATQRYALFGGLALMIVFGIFMFSRYKITQRQKKIIEVQKQEVEEKNKEILDSITYAKRLQEAILPSIESIKKHLPESFVFYKPKDIVAGDFYYFEKSPAEENTFFIAAADCTGHGVPGALVSVVCSNALNRCVKELRLTEPGKILDSTRDLVLETFTKSNQDVKDGMDISFAKISLINSNPENKLQKGRLVIPKGQSLADVVESSKRYSVQWSGANNPFWYLHNGELIEINPTKQPIGSTEYPKPFVTHSVELSKGDMIYLFTDGYPDQFGGEKKKKFKYKPFKELFLDIYQLPAEEQRSILEQRFNAWRGDLEQVDDVCIIGIRV